MIVFLLGQGRRLFMRKLFIVLQGSGWLLLDSMVLALTIVSTRVTTVEAMQGSRDKIESLFDNLANHNSRPTMISVGSNLDPSRSPLIGDNYDWEEDARVRHVAEELKQYDGDTLWWCLIAHMGKLKGTGTYFTGGRIIPSFWDDHEGGRCAPCTCDRRLAAASPRCQTVGRV